MARGKDELKTNLKKVPFHCYLPVKEFDKYKRPAVGVKIHRSNIENTRIVSEIVEDHLNDIPINKKFRESGPHVSLKQLKN